MNNTLPEFNVELQLLWNSIQRFRIRHRDQLVGGAFYKTIYTHDNELRTAKYLVMGKPSKRTFIIGQWTVGTKVWVSHRNAYCTNHVWIKDMLVNCACFTSNAKVTAVIKALQESEYQFQVWCMVRGKSFDLTQWEHYITVSQLVTGLRTLTLESCEKPAFNKYDC